MPAGSRVGLGVAEADGGSIFVSYRRQETSGTAGRLADQLVNHFGTSRVFIDVDTIEPGVDWAEAIAVAVEACEVVLAVIGPQWLTATDEQGRRRLDDPDDIVRIEIESALAENVRVIPILVENAVMPRRQELPESLATLARRNAFTIRHESFRYDAERLITSVESVLERARDRIRQQAAPPQEVAPPQEPIPPQEAARQQERVPPAADPESPPDQEGPWQVEQLEKNAEANKMTFRVWSDDEDHHVELYFPAFRSDVVRLDGERVNKSWINRDRDVPLALGETAGFVQVKVGSNGRILFATFKIGGQRFTFPG